MQSTGTAHITSALIWKPNIIAPHKCGFMRLSCLSILMRRAFSNTAFILPFQLSYAGPYDCAPLSSCTSVYSFGPFHENFSLGFRMLIIVKDLSIFGMEYIEIDNIPLKNAPFIAVHDHYVEFYACLNGKPDGSFLTNPVLDSRFRQRKFCISILFLRNPKNRLRHCPVEFDNSMKRLRFGDVAKQCCDAGTGSRRLRRFCPDFFEFRQKGSRFRFQIVAMEPCAKTTRPTSHSRDDLRVSVRRGR